MKKVFAFLFLLLFSSALLFSKTTVSTGPGNWSNAGTWSNGVPASGDIIIINHAVVFNLNFNLTGSGTITINASGSLIDNQGGPSYDLTLENSSDLILNGTLRIEGDFNMQNTSSLIINSCDTLETGSTLIENNTSVTVNSCAAWIINGSLGIENNTGLTTNGFIRVNGNVTSKNNAEISGSGNLSASGSVQIRNASQIFGSTSDCNSGPCFYGSGFPLPIELLSFKVSRLTIENILIEWEVEDENNVNYYSIQRSMDGDNWVEIESIRPMNSSQRERYEIEDHFEFTSVVYYRLNAVEMDGSEYNSDIVAVETNNESSKDTELKVYPNPARDYIFVKGIFSRVEIYTLSGLKVLESQEAKVDISNLAKGVYSVQATGINSVGQSSMLVVQ